MGSARPIPDAALAQHIAILGKTGSGKTYAAKGVVESILEDGGRACIIDPTGAWHGLRSSATGKSAGFPVVIFGGAHADLPLAGAHGEAIAEIIGTSSTAAILDTSLMKVSERTRFFADFADALVRKNKGPLHLIIDEAHVFAPQGRVSDPQSGAMLHAANNLVSLGRSRGLRIILITQRPAKLHKDSLTQVETLVAMRLIAPQDRHAVEDWIEDNADEKKGREIIESLATLKTGQGWVWAPELGVLERVTFPRIRTFDSSKAPDDTASGAGPVLAPIDREAIAARLKAVGADALASDPTALRRRIAELERQVRAKPAPAGISVNQVKAIEAKAISQATKQANDAARREAELQRRALRSALHAFIDQVLKQPPAQQGVPVVAAPFKIEASEIMHIERQQPVSSRPARAQSGNGHDGIAPVQQRILNALADLEQMGAAQPARELVAFMAGYKNVTSTGFAKAVGGLGTSNLISYPQAGIIVLTEEGRSLAQPAERPRTAEELQQRVISMVGGASSRVLKPLIDAYPKSIGRQDLAEASGYTNVTSTGFAKAMGRLRTLGFIDYPDRGTVVAKPVLFLE